MNELDGSNSCGSKALDSPRAGGMRAKAQYVMRIGLLHKNGHLSNAEAAQRFADRPNPDMVEIREALDDITRDDKRARGVIQGMRAMLKKEKVVVEQVDLNEIAAGVARIVRNEATLRGMRIELATFLSAVRVTGDHVALQQVVLNLASNGLDAMTDIATERRLTIRTAIETGASVGTIRVEDSGPGVNAEVR